MTRYTSKHLRQTPLQSTFACALLSLTLIGNASAEPHEFGLGTRPPTPEDKARDDEQFIHVEKAHLNQFGLDRVNQERVAKGLPTLSEEHIELAEGDDVYTGKTRKGNKAVSAKLKRKRPGSLSASSAATLSQGAEATGLAVTENASTADVVAMPGGVDNSQTIWFPPIGYQSGNACESWSSTYYTATYMVARAYNWNAASGAQDKILSPQFTFGLCNYGGNNGTGVGAVYASLMSHGAALLSAWPNGHSLAEYTKLPTTAKVWRDALHYRMGNSGSVGYLDTPAGINNLKTMLADGYILNFECNVYNMHFTSFKTCPAAGANNSLVGWPVVDYSQSKPDWSGHAMTIVGYDDNLWVDLNNNGTVEPGEMGALKIANQWGTFTVDFGNGGYRHKAGYFYLSYDALKAAPGVAGGFTGPYREPSFFNYCAYFLQARPAGYNPKVLGEFTLDTTWRQDNVVQLQRGATTTPPTTGYWNPNLLQWTGPLTYTGTCVVDFTDFLGGGASGNWFLKLTNAAATYTSLNSFVLTDGDGTPLAPCNATIPAGGLPQVTKTGTTVLYASGNLTVSDTIAPAAVTDLALVSNGSSNALLKWTQPGNDGMSGFANSYNFRCSTSPITAANFAAATVCAVNVIPGAAGSVIQGTVSGLPAGSTCYIAMQTSDASGNTSALSNVAVVTLPATLTFTSPAALPGAVVNCPYATQLAASGGVPPYTWSATTLPDGFTLDRATGILSGIPLTASTLSIACSVSDSGSQILKASKTLSLVSAATGTVIVPASVRLQLPAGSSVSLPVTLSKAPAAAVTVTATLASGAAGLTLSGTTALLFDSTNWNIPQTVTLNAQANVAYGQSVLTLSGSGLAPVPVILTESDTAPVLVKAAAAAASPVGPTQKLLSVLANDNNGEANLVYNWTVSGTPAAPVTFTVNNSNAAKNTAINFTKLGTYSLKVTAVDASGGTVSSSLSVTVSAVVVKSALTPAAYSVQAGKTQQFYITGFDQFGAPMTPVGTFTWSVAGGGTVSTNGMFTAGVTPGGPFAFTASASGVTATGSVTVTPTLAITNPSTSRLLLPNLANSLTLAGTSSSPDCSWYQVSGPAGGAVFARSGFTTTNSVKFTTAGTYTLGFTAGGATSYLVVGAGISSPLSLSESDIGLTGAAGSGSVSGTTFTVKGAGASIAGYGDAFHYSYTQLSGDCMFTARVASVQAGGDPWQRVGVMLRQSLDPAAPNALMAVTLSGGVTFQSRLTRGGATTSSTQTGLKAPYWVRLIRSGNSVTGYRSADGSNWTKQGTTQTITMTGPVLIGLAVSSHVEGVLATGTFTSVSGLPAVNATPQVNPGTLTAVTAGAPTSLGASAIDDGLPAGSLLTSTWSLVSGPAAPVFGSATTAATTVTLAQTGNYVLSLSASDSSATVFQNLALTASNVTVPPVQSGFSAWVSGYPAMGSLSGPMDDPKGTGIPNLISYGLGLDPTSAAAPELPAAGQADGFMTLTYRQNKTATDLLFVAEATDNIAANQWSAAGITETSRNDMGTYWQVTVSDSVPLSSGSRFMRLRVIAP